MFCLATDCSLRVAQVCERMSSRWKPAAQPDRCPKCAKSVYANEAKLAAGQKWHTLCFKCGRFHYKFIQSKNLYTIFDTIVMKKITYKNKLEQSINEMHCSDYLTGSRSNSLAI